VKSSWTGNYLLWVKQEVHFEQFAQEFTLLDYWHEVEHAAGRVERLDRAVEEAVKSAPPQMRAVIEGLQALRGIAQVSAVTIVAELGQISRFARARQLNGLQRGGVERRFQRRARPAGRDHQDRECAPATHRHGGRVVVPTPAGCEQSLTPAARGGQRRG